MIENPSFRKKVAIGLAGLALVASGCSIDATPSAVSAHQSETPNPSLVPTIIANCEKGPLSGTKEYNLPKGQVVYVGGITSAGGEEDILIESLGNGDLTPYLSFDETPDSKTGLVFHSQYFRYRITQGVGANSSSKGEILMDCITSTSSN